MDFKAEEQIAVRLYIPPHNATATLFLSLHQIASVKNPGVAFGISNNEVDQIKILLFWNFLEMDRSLANGRNFI